MYVLLNISLYCTIASIRRILINRKKLDRFLYQGILTEVMRKSSLIQHNFTGFSRRTEGSIFELLTNMLPQWTLTSFRPFRCNKLLLLRLREIYVRHYARPYETQLTYYLDMRTTYLCCC